MDAKKPGAQKEEVLVKIAFLKNNQFHYISRKEIKFFVDLNTKVVIFEDFVRGSSFERLKEISEESKKRGSGEHQWEFYALEELSEIKKNFCLGLILI